MSAVLDVADLTMHFGVIPAAEGLNVTVSSGELVGIIGPNGAGKTTFLNLVTGYVRPERGTVRFLDADLVGRNPRQITAMGVARSFQAPQLFLDLSVLENILVALATAENGSRQFVRRLRQPGRLDRARDILDEFGLAEAQELPANQLPEGGRKLLDVAIAYALGPKLLLMDEPTSGVSVDDKFGVMDRLTQVLRAGGVTGMFVEHDMEVVKRYAGRVLVLSEGRFIADGDPAKVLADPETRAAVAGWG